MDTMDIAWILQPGVPPMSHIAYTSAGRTTDALYLMNNVVQELILELLTLVNSIKEYLRFCNYENFHNC